MSETAATKRSSRKANSPSSRSTPRTNHVKSEPAPLTEAPPTTGHGWAEATATPILAGAVTLGLFAVLLAGLALVARVRRGSTISPGRVLGGMIGAGAMMVLPIGFSILAAVLASALLLAVAAPPITCVFTGLAAGACLVVALRHPDYGMEGCTKLFGLGASTYAIVWSALSWRATGGLGTLASDLDSLRWVEPPLAALPFAVAVTRLASQNKRTAGLFFGCLIFLCGFMAVCFFPVENGFARSLVPAGDWLRFPLTGLAIAVLLMLVRLAFVMRARPNLRRSRMRDWKAKIMPFATIMVAFGLSWALARTLVRITV